MYTPFLVKTVLEKPNIQYAGQLRQVSISGDKGELEDTPAPSTIRNMIKAACIGGCQLTG